MLALDQNSSQPALTTVTYLHTLLFINRTRMDGGLSIDLGAHPRPRFKSTISRSQVRYSYTVH